MMLRKYHNYVQTVSELSPQNLYQEKFTDWLQRQIYKWMHLAITDLELPTEVCGPVSSNCNHEMHSCVDKSYRGGREQCWQKAIFMFKLFRTVTRKLHKERLQNIMFWLQRQIYKLMHPAITDFELLMERYGPVSGNWNREMHSCVDKTDQGGRKPLWRKAIFMFKWFQNYHQRISTRKCFLMYAGMRV